ncbi:MAG: NAD(P)H-dependent oxidoreductase [Verrucomicrobia bacterium]|nr:NAD(P)H-dependent oxidoreductase [Verrucomicrobiota bacterium]
MKYILALLIIFSSLSAEVKILAIAGSTRKNSYNQKLVNQAAEIARQKGATVTVINLKDYPVPFYDGDLEAESGMPENAKILRAKMIESDGVILSTPEYNGAISGVLKNMIDWLSRAEKGGFSLDAFKDKPFALMSASVGKRGGQSALDNLTYIIEHIDGKVVPTKVALANAHSAFDEEGRLKDAAKMKELEKEIQELIRFSGKK